MYYANNKENELEMIISLLNFPKFIIDPLSVFSPSTGIHL